MFPKTPLYVHKTKTFKRFVHARSCRSSFHRKLQVQTLRGNNVSANLLQTLVELGHQVAVAHDLGRLRHLSQQLFQTAEETDQRAFVGVGHFAASALAMFHTRMHQDSITYQISAKVLPWAQLCTVSISSHFKLVTYSSSFTSSLHSRLTLATMRALAWISR